MYHNTRRPGRFGNYLGGLLGRFHAASLYLVGLRPFLFFSAQKKRKASKSCFSFLRFAHDAPRQKQREESCASKREKIVICSSSGFLPTKGTNELSANALSLQRRRPPFFPLAPRASLAETDLQASPRKLLIDRELLAEMHQVYVSQYPLSRKIRTQEGRLFVRNIQPYSPGNSAARGVVITFQEIDAPSALSAPAETGCDTPCASSRLTSRQRQILKLILSGNANKIIAAKLGISQRTVENHRASIMRKTGSKSLPDLFWAVLSSSPSWACDILSDERC